MGATIFVKFYCTLLGCYLNEMFIKLASDEHRKSSSKIKDTYQTYFKLFEYTILTNEMLKTFKTT